MTLRVLPGDEHLVGGAVRDQLERELTNTTALQQLDRRRRPEQEAGRRLVKHVDALWCHHPQLGAVCVGHYFAHVPNGGARSSIEAAIFAGQGVRKGYPDYVLDLPLGRYHGMRLELKALNAGKPDDEQLELLARLERAGYFVRVAWGADDAIRAVYDYLAQGSAGAELVD